MIKKFKDIDINNEKVRKIVNKAFEEFAKYGEDKASLNNILKTSGISKGVFYHYFNDKEDLFNFLINYTADISLNSINSKINWNEDDIIKRICDVSKYRLEIIKDYLFMMEFYDKFAGLIFESSDIGSIDVWKEKFYTHNINFGKLKDASSSKETIHIIQWTYKGIFISVLNKNMNNLNELIISKLIEECDRYYQVLASHFYK